MTEDNIESMQFGIDENLQVKRNIPIQPPQVILDGKGNFTGKYTWPQGYLISVRVADVEVTKGNRKGETVTNLYLDFVSLDGVRKFTHSFFDFNPTHKNKGGITDLATFNANIKHVYDEFALMPKGGIGKSAKTIKEYFTTIAHAFNTNGKDGTPIYKSGDKFIPVWLKLILYKGFTQFPYSPNFIERVKGTAECTLTVSKGDNIIPEMGKGRPSTDEATELGVPETQNFPDIV